MDRSESEENCSSETAAKDHFLKKYLDLIKI